MHPVQQAAPFRHGQGSVQRTEPCEFRHRRVAAIDIPVLVLGAAKEKLVHNADQKLITARIPKGRWIEIPGAYHELFQETDDIRALVWSEFDGLVAAL